MEKVAMITGSSGQDGPYLAQLLLKNNYKVICTIRSHRYGNMDNFKYLNIHKDIIVEELDLLDMANLMRVVKKYQLDEIYNLAAQSSVGLSFAQPIGTFAFNTTSVNNLLEIVRLLSPQTKIYQASSSDMYGNVKKMPINISTPMYPVSPYAVSKMASYFMLINYRKAYNIFASNGILFNHESFLRSGNFFIKKVIKSAILIKNNKLDKLIVGNLNIKRDFGYAPKYVEAMWKILQFKRADDFIVCSGTSIKLRDIVEYVFDLLNINKNLIIEDKSLFRANEIDEIYGDNTKSKKDLKWEYDYSFFDILDLLIKEELDCFSQ